MNDDERIEQVLDKADETYAVEPRSTERFATWWGRSRNEWVTAYPMTD